MRLAVICAALLVIPAIGAAKSETARIEILHGKRPFVTLAGADTAGQFTIWSGPGTSRDRRRRHREHAGASR